MHAGPEQGYSARGINLFGLYARHYFGRHFTALRISRSGHIPRCDAGTILYANHPSWWDPLVMLLFASGPLANRRIFAPIDAKSLERYPILRRLGLFPIELNTLTGSRRFLETAAALLANPDNVLAVTAQGQFSDQRARPLGLRNGISRLLCDDPSRVAIPVALEYSYWNDRLPEALVHFGKPLKAMSGQSVDAVSSSLEAALVSALDELASRSMSRDPALFDVLVGRKRTDVDGIYGFFRRIVRRPQRPGVGAPAGRGSGVEGSRGNDAD